MIQRFDTDTQAALLRKNSLLTGVPEVFPRRTRYGEADALSAGLQPVEDALDVLVNPDSYKEVIADCHARKIFPLYHQYASWCPPGQKWNQNGLGFCWTWSGTAALMTVRALEGKDTVQLAPVSMGYLVGWKNQGNYLESFIQGAREEGIAPASHVPNPLSIKPSQYTKGWDVERSKYRLDGVWDCNDRAGDDVMIQHCVSILAAGRPLYVAYNFWGHAVPIMALRWDESVVNNIAWVIRNSHNEDDVIELTGTKGVPSEAFGFISTKLAE